MDLISETESACSESSMESIRSVTNSSKIPKTYLLLNPNDPLLNNRYESIVSRHFSSSPFSNLKRSENFHQAFQKFEKLKHDSKLKKESKKILFNVDNVELTEEDCKLGFEDDELIDNYVEDISKQFERAFGTALSDCNSEDDNHQPRPYLEFDLPIEEQRQRLNKWLLEHKSEDLESKVTLTEDIEQHLSIQPFRISRRQRKKMMANQRKRTLTQWFDMPRVEEISKEQEKDLLALRMRRVWNPKQFYKKSSQIYASTGDPIDDQSKYFQIGTIQETASDFYSGRLTRRERKKTILDELMHDAQLQSYNKRKLQYAMTRNSRLKIMMKRAKLRRIKKRIRERKEERLNRFNNDIVGKSPHQRLNTFKTFEL